MSLQTSQIPLFATSRQSAREAGLKTYIGQPCVKCNTSIRFTTNCHCAQCNKTSLRGYHKANREKAQQYKREKQPIATQQLREWRDAHPEQSKAIIKKSQNKRQQSGKRRIYDLRYRYGLTQEQFDQMNERQGYACAICRLAWSEEVVMSVDHDHTDGRVRGLLCGKCNRMIGLSGDNVVILRQAIGYLEK